MQGRFIVHPRNSRDLSIHEVVVDLQNANYDEQGNIVKIGNFKTVSESLDEYKSNGINCIYLMGALERDNGMYIDEFSRVPRFEREHISFLAITSRDTPNRMLGGNSAFKELTKKANEKNIKILIDSLTRVSSARMHKKYKKHILTALDKFGK